MSANLAFFLQINRVRLSVDISFPFESFAFSTQRKTVKT